MKNFRRIIYLALLSMVFLHCSSKNRDVIIKKDLAIKAKGDLSFAGVRFHVNDGLVTLNGACATVSARDEVYTKVSKLFGVKNVVNNIAIDEVVIGRDWLLKQSVDSVLTEYAQVEGVTRDSVITLLGHVDADKKQKLLLTMKALRPVRLELKLD